MQSWHPQDGNCCWQSATVDAHGNSIGCPYLREYVNFGNVQRVDFLESWFGDPLYRKLRRGAVDKTCPDCRSSEGSSGGCRSTAYAFHGSWTAPDPFCRALNDGVRIDVLPERLLRQDADPAHPPRA
jgi:radical SAM protein with 4Fe4S-binding SPASM domain